MDIDIIENMNIHLDGDKHYRKQRCTVCPLAQIWIERCIDIDIIENMKIHLDRDKYL